MPECPEWTVVLQAMPSETCRATDRPNEGVTGSAQEGHRRRSLLSETQIREKYRNALTGSCRDHRGTAGDCWCSWGAGKPWLSVGPAVNPEERQTADTTDQVGGAVL